ncbi:hypothetical protein O6H91_21G057600 [Diphasiastrum complanatum]|uniref:Uncharacterized protein n=2 Tax=Diphasiastrum complanatum TaxID=34168 RepID=A0ACC2AKR1_DIPCM|nr:hypothetical protein O6H91_21G057000 [Diphasiastrum complanatum]KAJ7518164.1 hypothetical protein O6H91_21G057600 [Diphasiastrum complanatum]
MTFDDRHHAFIQALMVRGPFSEDVCKTIFRELFVDRPGNEGTYFDFLGALNKELDFVQMEVRACRNQHNGSTFYGLINKLGSEEAKLGTRYSHSQITFFRAIMEAIVQGPSGNAKISSIEALNLRVELQSQQQSDGVTSQSPAGSKLTMAQKEKTLTDLIADKWLSHTDDGLISLGIRTFLELRNVFKNLDIPFCDVCNEAGIKATLCQNEECTVRMHQYCAHRKFARPDVPKLCPSCGAEWIL